MNKTSIEWTDLTWNPVRARRKGDKEILAHISEVADHGPLRERSGTFCTRISPGCTNCYASVINKRFGTGLEFTVPNLAQHEFFLDERILAEPVRRQKPSRIFVGDMFDLFHEAIPAEFVAEVLRVALKTPRHTFQFLTKRADRMRRLVNRAQEHWGVEFGEHMWFGVSVESQNYANERVSQLLEHCLCAVKFLSVEPLLESVDLGTWLYDGYTNLKHAPGIDWVICGGESGPNARPFNLAWAESLLAQCRAAGVPFFLKQLGSNPYIDRTATSYGLKDIAPGLMRLSDRKGGNMSEWPEHLRVREFPSRKAEAVPA
jgi:protein gp37